MSIQAIRTVAVVFFLSGITAVCVYGWLAWREMRKGGRGTAFSPPMPQPPHDIPWASRALDTRAERRAEK